MCFDGGVGHSGENAMKARFQDDWEKIKEKHPNVTLKQVYEDACYYPHRKKYFNNWGKQKKSSGTVNRFHSIFSYLGLSRITEVAENRKYCTDIPSGLGKKYRRYINN